MSVRARSTKRACKGDSKAISSATRTPAIIGPTMGIKLRSPATALKERRENSTPNNKSVTYVARNTNRELITIARNQPESFRWERAQILRASASYFAGNSTLITRSMGRSSRERNSATEITKIVEKSPPKIAKSALKMFAVFWAAFKANESTKLWKSRKVATQSP